MTPQPAATARRGRAAGTWDRISRNPTLGLLALLLVMWALAWILVPNFGSVDNIRTVLRQASDLGVAAIGILFVLLIGGIDLSVGALYGLSSVVLVTVMIQTGSLPLALAAALGAGVLFGLLNGVLVQWVRIPAFITTLGGFYIAFALAQMISAGSMLSMPADDLFVGLQTGLILGIPYLVILAVVVAAIAWVVLNHTTFGRSVVAVGYNRVTAGLSGVRVARIVISCFAICSGLAALAAVMLTSRVQIGVPTLGGFNATFETITAAVVGGTSLFGGRGTVVGVIIGAIIIRTINNCIVLLNIPSQLYQAVMGLIIVTALVVDAARSRYLGERT
ncbi:MAG TPA: ABC transporter permease [Candidatus Deferrimicrobium sp.]|nr:ABC transporter permease [Candidatus Deferrimicrobium sp.]